MNPILELNKEVFLFLNQKIANSMLDFVVLYIFIPSFSLLLILPIYMLIESKYNKDKKILALFALFSGFFLYWLGDNLLKPLFDIPRPSALFENVRKVGPFKEKSSSFPSTTTMFAFGLSLPIIFHQRKIGVFVIFLSLLVGFSVIYTGFHTPLDVISGILFSILFVIIFDKIINIKL